MNAKIGVIYPESLPNPVARQLACDLVNTRQIDADQKLVKLVDVHFVLVDNEHIFQINHKFLGQNENSIHKMKLRNSVVSGVRGEISEPLELLAVEEELLFVQIEKLQIKLVRE